MKGFKWFWRIVAIVGRFRGLCLTPFFLPHSLHKDRNTFKFDFYSTVLQLFRGGNVLPE